MLELGINIDHVATVREARKTYEPSVVEAALASIRGGADCITIHLREDRRHIQDLDAYAVRDAISTKLNFEMSIEREIVDIACDLLPPQATLVPEKREEVTTEGGLNVTGQPQRIETAIKQLQDAGIAVSLFLDPESSQIEAAAEMGCQAVELHTGQYALANSDAQVQCLNELTAAGKLIVDCGMKLHAGHGLNYDNVTPVAQIDQMIELNIGHSIISRAIFTGLEQAVREMKQLLTNVESNKP